MDVLSPLILLLFRSLVVLLPLTVGWLAFRRLLLSKSANAWIYAVTCLFAAVTTAGLIPWAFGITQVSWVFFVFSAFCPAIWIGVLTICDMSRRAIYAPDPVADTVMKFKSTQKPTPLVLENPDWPGAPVPLFRHRTPANARLPAARRMETTVSAATKSLMSIAREMRGNKSSEARRPKMLPAPDTRQIAHIKEAGNA